MAVKFPDILQHNNAQLAIADADNIRGGRRVVADLSSLYALSGNTDQLKQYATIVFVDSNDKEYLLTDMNNVGNASGWTEYNSTVTWLNIADIPNGGNFIFNQSTSGQSANFKLIGYGFATAFGTTDGFHVMDSGFTATKGYITHEPTSDSFSFLRFGGWGIRVNADKAGIGVLNPTATWDVGGNLKVLSGATFSNLSGTTTRMAVITSGGTLSVQAVPSGSTPTLQQVTDAGNETTGSIKIVSGGNVKAYLFNEDGGALELHGTGEGGTYGRNGINYYQGDNNLNINCPAISDNRTIEYPDKSGTVALVEDLTSGFMEAEVTTTTTGSTTIATIATTENSALSIDCIFVGFDTISNAVSRFGVNYMVKNIGGTVTLEDSEATFGSQIGSFAGGVGTPAVSGSNVLLKVNGGTTNATKWKVSYRVVDVIYFP